MAFYRFLSIYLPSRPKARTKAWAGAGVRAQETAGVRVRVPIFLVRALSASLFFVAERGLQRVCNLAIWLAKWVNFKDNYSFYSFFQ